ncbi:CarD family transcriptional regulator [Bartonella sp. B10]
MASQNSTSSNAKGFSTSEYIVYPTHGVGQIVAIEDQEVAGHKLKLFVIHFAKDRMDIKVPIAKAISVGMRKLSAMDSVERALKVLQGKARIKRAMWSRRAQEYDTKINSGDLICIAEVVRDLFRSNLQPEQSYSERQLYIAALDRMAREIAVINSLSETEAINLIEMHLSSKPKHKFKTEVDETDASSNTVCAA